MSLTRNFITAMGIEEAKAIEICNAHQETLEEIKKERDGLKEQVKKYKADADKLPDVQQELEKLQKEQSKASSYEEKYTSLKAEYDKYKADIEAKVTLDAKTEAYKKLLKQAKISDNWADVVMKASADAINGLKIDSDGKVEGEADVIKAIQTEWAKCVETEGMQGAKTETPPANNGGTTSTPSRASQLADKYYEEHYGKAKEV